MRKRCPWAQGNGPLYMEYHDREWGVPQFDDKIHFEFLVLESAQAGLSWMTILKRREGYKKAYEGFNAAAVAQYGEKEKKRLLADERIIRNRLKIEASVNNAVRFLETAGEFGTFARYLWSFTGFKPVVGGYSREEDIPAETGLSRAISQDMKKRGFKFIGPVIIYSHLQATGIVNDHLTGCFRFKEIMDSYEKIFKEEK